VTAGIIASSCILFPAIVGNLAALILTSALSIFIGLKIALPPLNPEDDWVPIHDRVQKEEKASSKPATVAEVVPIKVKLADGKSPTTVRVLPVHARRAIPETVLGAPTRNQLADKMMVHHSLWERLHQLGVRAHRPAHVLHKN
jgi:hypothetical protein